MGAPPAPAPPRRIPPIRRRRAPAVVPTGRNVALQMSECEVVRAMGRPGDVQIAANERGDRMVTMTYMTPERPIYRFVAGRLASIERGAEPPPPEPVKKNRPRSRLPRKKRRHRRRPEVAGLNLGASFPSSQLSYSPLNASHFSSAPARADAASERCLLSSAARAGFACVDRGCRPASDQSSPARW